MGADGRGAAGQRDRAGVVNPVNGGWLGEGGRLSRAGIPTIGYIPQPNYLLAGPADCCIEKLSPELLHSQILVFAKLIHDRRDDRRAGPGSVNSCSMEPPADAGGSCLPARLV